MKVSDHTMTIMTGLVLTVTIGMLAQNSESIMAGLSGGNILRVQDDAYTVRAGKPQMLDVLLNDQFTRNSDESPIVIVNNPSCGSLSISRGQVQFFDSETCRDEVQFTYCLAADAQCSIATVALQVLPPAGNAPVAASAAVAELAASPAPSDPMPEIALAEAPTPSPSSEPMEVTPQSAIASMQAPDPAAKPEDPALAENFDLSGVPEIAPDSGVFGGTTNQPVVAASAGIPAPLSAETGEVRFASLSGPRPKDGIAAKPESGETGVALAANVSAPAMPETADLTGQFTVALAAVVMPQPEPDPEPELACTVDVVANPAPGGEIALTVNAPCLPGSALTVRQGAFEFLAFTDAGGIFQGNFPAFAIEAVVSVDLADGIAKSVPVTVPDAERFTRVALLWSGSVDLDLHAREYGAKPGQAGYVWSGDPSSYRQSRQSGGGYLLSFGSGDAFAEIYTMPLSKRQANGVIDLSLHVADGTRACDQGIELRVLRFQGGNSDASNVRFTLGPCGDNMPGYEVFNALGDLRLAAR